MSTSDPRCDPERIELFLEDALDRDEEVDFERHLETCAGCRSLLESAAAGASLWREVREHLAECELAAAGAGADASGAEAPERSPGPPLGFLGPTDHPHMLGRFGGYEIAGVIGQGGMGIVLKGFDSALHRYVAIKVLAPQLATNAAARRRFAREAQAAAAVVHENVIAIHGVAEANGLPYLVMPYVRGLSLQRRLEEEGPLGLAEVLRVAMQTAAGLAAAHAQGLVHRDVKPANILLAEGVERVTLTDFGLARAADDASLTRTGVIAGTPLYMSPEQARGESVDQRSDLFSLGSVMYTMCTGRPPFRAETSFGVLRRISDAPARPLRALNPGIPVWLERIVATLHAKEPSARYQSAAHVAQLLERALAHVQDSGAAPLPEEIVSPHPLEGARGTAPRPVRRLWRFPRQTALLASAVAATAVLAWCVWPAGRAPREVTGRDATAGGTAVTRVVTPSEPGDSAGGSPPPATLPAGERGIGPAASAWEDGLELELGAIEAALRRLEAAAGDVWPANEPGNASASE